MSTLLVEEEYEFPQGLERGFQSAANGTLRLRSGQAYEAVPLQKMNTRGSRNRMSGSGGAN
jgi:hypothetical protein